MSAAGPLCVAHLVRARNGVAPFERFLASYRRHAAGEPHRLLLVFKGFRGGADLAPYDALAADLPHDRVHVPDRGYDIRAYVVAARETGFERYCFLNSFSVVLDDGWLAKLAAHARPGAPCLVGATGSWISHLTEAIEETAFGTCLPIAGRRLRMPGFVAGAARHGRIAFARRRFDPFPNHHLRTTCFLVTRDLLLRAAPRVLFSKIGAWSFESSKTGLSATAAAAGAELLVVGRDGNGYRAGEWAESCTFWQRDQENLLVADNQTMRYQAADLATRATLARTAWGEWARPTVPVSARVRP